MDPMNADGGRIVKPCGTLTALNVDATVNGINANSLTPLGETLAEIWQYFKGETSSYNSGVTYTSPITSPCQKSFTIIVTDGEPTADNRYNGDFSSYGWLDNDSVNLTTTHLPDVAGFMYTNSALATFPGSNVTTYTVGFDIDSQILQTTAANGGGQYFTAANEAALASALQTVVSTIIATVSSAAPSCTGHGSIPVTGAVTWKPTTWTSRPAISPATLAPLSGRQGHASTADRPPG
jgi:type IV pilus assembly protein PilY1